VNVFSPLSASAFASPMSGMAPLTVQFSASASGGTPPYSYSWNFGDGALNNQQNSSHTYSNAGTYTATLNVTDNTGAKVSSSIQITVNQVNNPPVARDDVTVTNEDTPISINVLANDSDADGDKLTVISVTQPINGTAQISANGSIRYSPKRDFNGQDSFTYVISDGRGGTATAKVTVTVNPVNDAPVAIDDVAATNENTPKSINVLANDSDVDGDKLTIASATQGKYGVVSISANGSITYSPNQGFLGQDTFTYTMSDGNGGTATAKVTMTVNAVNHPPVARDDIATTNKNTPISINVLINDNDPDGDKLTITAVTQPSNGTIQISANSVTYSPRQDFYGQDTFTYTISDGKGGTATARVSVTVNQMAQYYINKKSSGLVASDPRTDPKTRQELEADQRYWRYGGSAVAQNAPVDFFQDSMGLDVGVKAGSNGTYAGFYAVTPNTNASLFHAIITTPTRTIPNNFFQNGLYVQTANGLINYVTCYSVTSTAGTTWHILHTYGNTTYSTKWIVLWSDPSPSQPLTRECTIITNGRNYLKVYLDSIKVYENNTLDLQMPAPFNAYLEPQNSYAGQMLYGIYRDFYIALDENVRVTNVPPEATRVDIVDASNNVLASSAVANGIAVLNIAQYHFPLAVNIKVYDMNNNVIASSSVSIVGGDIYSVDPAQLPNSLSFGQWPDQILAVRREVLSIPKYG
jgi:VCBS repeat-containing protein